MSAKSSDKKGSRLKRLILKARDMCTRGMSKSSKNVHDPLSDPASGDQGLRIPTQEAELRRSRSTPGQPESVNEARGGERVSRSRSAVQISRIDEDSACEFEEDARSRQLLIPRSRSFALEAKRRRSRGMFEDRVYWRNG